MKKILFICMTDYQIINSINLKMNLFPKSEADILIGDYRENLKELVIRLEKTYLFDNVYHYVSRLPGIANYIRGLRESKSNTLFVNALKNETENILNKIKTFKYGKEYAIYSKIWGNKVLNFGKYDEVFGFHVNTITSDIMELIKLHTGGRCILHCIDEGIGSYTTAVVHTNTKIDDIYLYRPDLAIFKNIKIKKIPPINKRDRKLIDILNYIYNYKEERDELYKKIIFFDQAWVPMPKYLIHKNILKKFLFRRRYIKHSSESKMHLDKMRIFRNLLKICGTDKVFVKLHPRSISAVIEAYKNYNCKFIKNSSMPWELFCINSEFKNNIFVTVHSSALGTYDFTVDNDNNNNNVCIYTYLLGDFKTENSDIELFYEKYAHNAMNVYIPKTYKELEKILIKYQNAPK